MESYPTAAAELAMGGAGDGGEGTDIAGDIEEDHLLASRDDHPHQSLTGAAAPDRLCLISEVRAHGRCLIPLLRVLSLPGLLLAPEKERVVYRWPNRMRKNGLLGSWSGNRVAISAR